MGLVVGIDAPTPASRERYLRERSARKGLSVAPDILAWVVSSLPGSLRQLEGVLTRLETLARGIGRHDTLCARAAMVHRVRMAVEAALARELHSLLANRCLPRHDHRPACPDQPDQALR